MAQPMSFFKRNQFGTVTMAKVDAVNTSTVNYAIDHDRDTQWTTVGYGTNTSTIFSVELPTATVISQIFLQNHNLKQFRIFYNSVTANTFTPAITKTTNSDASNYFSFASITVNSIQVQVDLAMTADTEKRIGELYIGDVMLSFERNPSAANYKPLTAKQKVIHRMPNGGVTMFIVDQKYKGEISWKHLTASFTSQLQNIYDTGTTFYFMPFLTSTTWNGDAYEVAWTNDFDFRFSDNNKVSGMGGKIIIEEIA